MTTTTFHQELIDVSPTRQRVMGAVFILLGLAIWFLFARPVDPDLITTFIFTTPGFAARPVADLEINAGTTIYSLAFLSVLLGVYQAVRGFRRWTNWVLAFVVAFFIISFLTWAAAGRTLNVTGLLNSTLLRSVPITLGALSGILCERAGVVNIAIEGMMLTAAMASTIVGSVTGNLWLGLLAGIASGGFIALIHAILSIKYKTNQIISGTVINIFATGLTSYISSKFLRTYQNLNTPGIFPRTSYPGPFRDPRDWTYLFR
jgi:general nucleoside transport system permease protein